MSFTPKQKLAIEIAGFIEMIKVFIQIALIILAINTPLIIYHFAVLYPIEP